MASSMRTHLGTGWHMILAFLTLESAMAFVPGQLAASQFLHTAGGGRLGVVSNDAVSFQHPPSLSSLWLSRGSTVGAPALFNIERGRLPRPLANLNRRDRVQLRSSSAPAQAGEDKQEVKAEDLKNFFPKVARLMQPYWSEESKGRALVWSVVTLLLAVVTTLYSVGVSFVQKFFWNALNAKDSVKFGKFLTLYIAILTFGPPLLVLFDWAKARMSLGWREALTEKFLGSYFLNKTYYNLELNPATDNNDQRIAEDIRAFCDKAVSLLCTLVVSVLDLVVFSIILYRIYPPLYFLLIAYATIGTSVTIFFGKPLVRINRQQAMKEANFRFGLVRVRENAESIAFYGGGPKERAASQHLFGELLKNRVGLLNFERNLNFFTRWYRYLVQVLPAVVIGPQYFAGKVPLGAISQTFFSFNHVLNDLSVVVNEFTGPNGLSSFSAQVERLNQLQDGIEKAEQDGEIGGITFTEPSTDGSLSLRQLDVRVPGSERVLVQGLSWTVGPGQASLVVGLSGIGKSSLMRAVAGLWREGGGEITRPAPDQTLFLSQKPYLTLGSLRDNVLYPSTDRSEVTDEMIEEALQRVNLPDVSARLGGVRNSDKPLSAILSLGEQQRLAFARVVTAKPRFVILDESTSALDLDNEERMYQILRQSGATVLSVGNRPSLLPFHDTVLRLLGDGRWQADPPAAGGAGGGGYTPSNSPSSYQPPPS